MPAIGELDRRIVLQRATRGAADWAGHEAETWGTLATVWAKYVPVSDGEKVAAGQREAALMARFVIRHSSTVADLDAKDRVSFGGLWNILGVKETPDGRNRFIEITAVRKSD